MQVVKYDIQKEGAGLERPGRIAANKKTPVPQAPANESNVL
jgi:hypothetical protein